MKNRNKIYAMLIIGLFLIGMGADIGYAKISKPDVNKTATVEKAKKKQSVAKSEDKDNNEAIKAEDKSEPNEKATPATKSKIKNKESKKATSKTSKTSSKANNKKSGTKTNKSSNNSSSSSKPKGHVHSWHPHYTEWVEKEAYTAYDHVNRPIAIDKWVTRADGSSYSTVEYVEHWVDEPYTAYREIPHKELDYYYCDCGAVK